MTRKDFIVYWKIGSEMGPNYDEFSFYDKRFFLEINKKRSKLKSVGFPDRTCIVKEP